MDNQEQLEQTYTQEDHDEAQTALLNWMAPIILRMITQQDQQDDQQKAA